MHQKKRIVTIVGVFLLFLLAGGWYLWSRTEGGGKELSPVVTESVFQASDVTPQLSPEPVKVQEKKVITVFLCGAVCQPGVYELPEASRLYEAVDLAGGLTKEADTTYHNLARPLKDGERIYFLTKEETKELTLPERLEGENAAHQSDGKVNINTAETEELTTLPGIGLSRAEQIVAYRQKVGNFTAIEEIMNISGIGEAMFEKIQDKITVE